jgi:hypothetical protein
MQSGAGLLRNGRPTAALTMPSKPAILYYKFKAFKAATTAFYSDDYLDDNDNLNKDGAGAASDGEPFNSFQITVYDPNFQTPVWLQNANVYRIVALVNNAAPNLIANDIVRAVESRRCPLLLTGRTEHLQYFAAKLEGIAKHVFVLHGGMGKKQRRETAAALAAVPESESRVILATGSYIEKGLTTRAWTRYFWPCQSPGRARCNSMWPIASSAR